MPVEAPVTSAVPKPFYELISAALVGYGGVVHAAFRYMDPFINQRNCLSLVYILPFFGSLNGPT